MRAEQSAILLASLARSLRGHVLMALARTIARILRWIERLGKMESG
jgi:hypothetical protein